MFSFVATFATTIVADLDSAAVWFWGAVAHVPAAIAGLF